MEDREYLYSGSAWFKERLDGPDGALWRRARKMFLFDNTVASALNLFEFDHRAIHAISRPEGTELVIGTNTNLREDEEKAGRAWTDDANNAIRHLLDRIVTQWRPDYLEQRRIKTSYLHRSLIPSPLRPTMCDYDGTDDHVNNMNVKRALSNYHGALVPLHYHELWSEIVHDYKSVETTLEQRKTLLKLEKTFSKETLDEEYETALVFGTNRTTYVDNFKRLNNKLSLFDLVLLTVDKKRYFGMIVHVEQNKVKTKSEGETSTINAHQHKDLEFEIHTTICVYASREYSDAINANKKETGIDQLMMTKIGNITSSRRMICAIHNIQDWPLHRSLLKPTIDDPYFQLPNQYESEDVIEHENFNLPQSKAINIAQHMFNDIQERMHLVHGPPGTGKSRTIAGIVRNLLKTLGKKRKILLCAPSNNACDELCRRILDEFARHRMDCEPGTLVRIGCQPPDDYRLCDHFLDFMVLKDLVEVFKEGGMCDRNIAGATQSRIARHAKIVVSTLNYCGSARMSHLKNETDFIIIDEATQSLEADFLLPLRFRCSKVMLVGDPMQLPPCVLSKAGKKNGLSQSLYARLYSIFNNISDGSITMLDTQYRMHPDICRFPSNYFYDQRLFTDPSVATGMRQFPLKPLFLYNLTRSEHQHDADLSSNNENEALLIQSFCQRLISFLVHEKEMDSSESEDSDDDDDSSDNPGENETERRYFRPIPYNDPRALEIQKRIAIITPYHAQIRLLRSKLPPTIEIMTVDSSQGKEKDIVIISCVRSGDTIGFLKDPNRMNVMLTRSKFGLYVFGNLTQLAAQNESWQALVNHARTRAIISDVNDLSVDLPYR